mgnify:CR=1 FL=1
MTVVNPKSISGINSITTGSGSDNLLTIHTSDASNTERVRINSSGDVIIGSGVTLSPDGDGFFTGVVTATSYAGDGSALTGIAATANVRTGILDVAGIGTFRGNIFQTSGRIVRGSTSTIQDGDAIAGGVNITGTDMDASVIMSVFGNDNDFNRISGAKSRNATIGSHTVVNNGDTLLSLKGFGSDGTDFEEAAQIEMQVDGSPGDNDMPGRIVFKTTSDGAASPTERLRITSTGNVGIGIDNPQEILHVKAASEAIGNRDGVIFGSTDSLAADKGLPLVWAAHIGTDADYGIASICGRKENATSDNGAGYLQFGTGTAAGAIEERMRIDSSGRMGLGTNNPEYLFNVVSSNNDMCRFQQTTNDGGSSYSMIFMKHAAARSGSNGIDITFQNDSGTTVGQIDHGQSTTQYRTSSDYRLKENAVAISDGITRLKTLKPYRFNWISDPDQPKVDGFFAHEVTAVPEAISGTKDQVDSDNNPVYQAIDHSKLVPLLTAALQEAITEIETLKTKVAALESA